MKLPSAPKLANGITVIAANIISGKLTVSIILGSSLTPTTNPIMLK